MNNSGLRRRPTPRGSNDLRLEGLVVEKRLTRVEATRYLVIDFNAGSISVYKKPPPKDEFSAMQKRSKSSPASKLISSVANSLTLTRSTSDEGGSSMTKSTRGHTVTCENLAHMSRKQRHFSGGAWDPKFTVPSSVDWKIR